MKDNLNALPPGYRLQEYEVIRVLGVGGFGITYLCFDHNLDQARAIKEYLPNDLAIRLGDNTVHWKATEAKEDFEAGLQSFLDEARRLARFKHDNIVKVHRSFSELGTAYIVMEYAEGETLSSILGSRGTISEQELKAILLPILDGLEEVHKILIHRDIKPGNIIIRDVDDSPVLLDFGSARQAIGSKSKSMTAIVTAGFAPMEQYSTQGNQGPWTDIYALGCLCYRALTGEPPKEAPLRIRNDPVIPISVVCKGKADEGFLKAIDWALQVYEDERPQSIAEWRAAILGASAPAVTRPAAPVQISRQPAVPEPPKRRFGVAMAAALVAVAAIGGYLVFRDASTPVDPVSPVADLSGATADPGAPDVVTGPVDTPAPGVVTDAAQAAVQPGADEPSADTPGAQTPASQTPVAVVREAPFEVSAPPEPQDLIANAEPAPDVAAAGTVFRDRLADGTLGPLLVTVPAGEFRMGNSQGNGEPDEEPAHNVAVTAAFALGRHEVSFAEYDQFARATGVNLPDDGGWGRNAIPALNISWHDAAAYVRWLSEQTGETYRLPSEAEWEYAARAGSTSSYAWGGSVGEAMANCRGCSSVARNAPTAVGSFPPNAFGIHDLQGNVWEWVQDCARDSYVGAPADASVWEGDAVCSRVLRGGSWSSTANQLRSSYRNWYPPVETDDSVGFRVVREIGRQQ